MVFVSTTDLLLGWTATKALLSREINVKIPGTYIPLKKSDTILRIIPAKLVEILAGNGFNLC